MIGADILSVESVGQLSQEEKQLFIPYLQKQGLSTSIFDCFDAMINQMSALNLYYLKISTRGQVVGVCFFSEFTQHHLSFMLGRKYRNNCLINKVLSYFPIHFAYAGTDPFTASLHDPLIVIDKQWTDKSLMAIYEFYKVRAAPFCIIESRQCHSKTSQDIISIARGERAFFDADGYVSFADYLTEHKKLARRERQYLKQYSPVMIKTTLTDADILQMRACFESSAVNALEIMPMQELMNQRFAALIAILEYAKHFLLILEGKIVAFMSVIESGNQLGGVMGGVSAEMHKKYKKHAIYERVISAIIKYSIENNIQFCAFSYKNNVTKCRYLNHFSKTYFHIQPLNMYRKLQLQLLKYFWSLRDMDKFD
ncbi:hypothetical protein [uncultured Shewanella sp.]|uniref:hypothetical protein n=1 Tax=uncultured Shewanella sp. TaxID=173975 RepID=UPI00261A23FF|nr:hypothetical protein [uncultured Shewanella sp.]